LEAIDLLLGQALQAAEAWSQSGLGCTE
jgi:hypothetical protein